MSVKPLLTRLDSWLAQHRPEYHDALLPGATPDEIAALERQTGQTLPAGFREFLAWKCAPADLYEPLLDNWCLMGGATAIGVIWKIHQDLLAGSDFEAPHWWNSAWIPFLENGGGDHLCLDLAGTFTGHPGQVMEFWHDWEARSVTHPSFDLWLEVFVRSLEAGGWEMSEDDDFESNEKFSAIYEELCPGYPQGFDAG